VIERTRASAAALAVIAAAAVLSIRDRERPARAEARGAPAGRPPLAALVDRSWSVRDPPPELSTQVLVRVASRRSLDRGAWCGPSVPGRRAAPRVTAAARAPAAAPGAAEVAAQACAAPDEIESVEIAWDDPEPSP
jgi:hypothetical protein